jgi:hypothetical protein
VKPSYERLVRINVKKRSKKNDKGSYGEKKTHEYFGLLYKNLFFNKIREISKLVSLLSYAPRFQIFFLIILYTCSFKFILKVGVKKSIVNVPRITHHGLAGSITSLFMFLHCRLMSGAFTIGSSTPSLRINLNEHPTKVIVSEIPSDYNCQ